jgi:hypothetical protein
METYKILLKEFLKDLITRKIPHVHGSEKLLLLTRQHTDSTQFVPKSQVVSKTILKFMWQCKGPKTAQTVSKKNTIEKSHFSILKLTTKLCKISTVWHKNGPIAQGNRSERPEANLTVLGQVYINVKKNENWTPSSHHTQKIT